MHTTSAPVASMDIMHRLYDLLSASFGKEVLLNNVCVHLTHAPAMSGTTKASPPPRPLSCVLETCWYAWQHLFRNSGITRRRQPEPRTRSSNRSRRSRARESFRWHRGSSRLRRSLFLLFFKSLFFQMPFQGQNEGVRERGRERRRGLAAEYKEFTVSPTVRLEMRAHPRTGSR